MKNGEHLTDKSHAYQAEHIKPSTSFYLRDIQTLQTHSPARPSHSARLAQLTSIHQPSQSPHRQLRAELKRTSIAAYHRFTAHFVQQTDSEHGHATHVRHPNRATNPNLHLISIVLPGPGQVCQVCALPRSSASSLSCSYSHVLSLCVNKKSRFTHLTYLAREARSK